MNNPKDVISRAVIALDSNINTLDREYNRDFKYKESHERLLDLLEYFPDRKDKIWRLINGLGSGEMTYGEVIMGVKSLEYEKDEDELEKEKEYL
jgi:hypothetical protein